jgi:hypothetical protein
MPASTAELQNWRNRPEYFPMRDEGTAQLFNLLRGQSWGNMGTINRMPMVFDPSKFWTPGIGVSSPEDIRNAIKPGSGAPGGGLLAMLGPQTIAGLLGQLGIQK